MPRNHRFTINNQNQLSFIKEKIIRSTDPEIIHQLNKVLRIKDPKLENPNIEISLIDGSGIVYECQIKEYIYDEKNSKTNNKNLNEIIFQITEQYESKRELTQELSFFIPIIKIDRFEWMVQKLSELGVQKLIPVIFERSQKNNIEKLQKQNQQKRLEKIIEEAIEQCEGAAFPELMDIINFSDLNKHLQDHDLKLFASERLASQEGLLANKDTNNTNTELPQSIKLLVGPEGGLTDQEVRQLESLGFQAKSLGKRLLKAETASVVLFTHAVLK